MRALVFAVALGVVSLAAVPARGADLLLAGFSADTIFKYDGVTATPFASHATMDGPTAMVYDASGNLLVLNEFSHNVLKFDGTTGAYMSEFISPATLAVGGSGGLDPGDMELGSDGHLYIMSHHNDAGNMIHRFNGTTGAYMGVFAGPGAIRHQHGLASGPGGHWYQGLVDTQSVEKFDGTTGASLGIFATGDPSMVPAADLAFGPAHLYLTTAGSYGVARFDATTGAYLGPLAGTAGAPFWGILVDGPDLYLSNLGAGTIMKFDAATGAFISSTSIGGGAFDIIAIPPPIPEPAGGTILLGLLATLLRRRRSQNEI